MIKDPDLLRTAAVLLSTLVLISCGLDPTASPPSSTSETREEPPAPTLTLSSPSEVTPTPSSPAERPTAAATSDPEEALTLWTTRGILPGKALKIRQGPDSDATVSGLIPAGAVSILAGEEPIPGDQGSWLRVTYRDQSGWAPTEHLARQKGTLPEDIVQHSLQVLELIEDNDLQALTNHIHPSSCLRFSPYPYLQPEDQVVCPPQIRELKSQPEPVLWGRFDGSGKPINMTYGAYYDQFIYDQNYLKAPVIGLNQAVSTGNAPNNIPEVYPGAVFIEYHFPGIDPQYGGLDWRSLRLVYQQIDSTWYLTAIVHGEWTI